jgi:hypothetical protein
MVLDSGIATKENLDNIIIAFATRLAQAAKVLTNTKQASPILRRGDLRARHS